MNNQKLISLDPSSTRTGYAIWHGEDLVRADYLDGGSSRVANERILKMLIGLADLCVAIPTDLAVLEDTSGRVGARHRGAGAGLAVYGKAIGAIWVHLMAFGLPTKMVKENDWCRGRPKAQRTAEIVALYPTYAKIASRDRGGDIADAIGLGLWWLERARLRR